MWLLRDISYWLLLLLILALLQEIAAGSKEKNSGDDDDNGDGSKEKGKGKAKGKSKDKKAKKPKKTKGNQAPSPTPAPPPAPPPIVPPTVAPTTKPMAIAGPTTPYPKDPEDPDDAASTPDEEWANYKKRYDKKYNTPAEDKMARQNFFKNRNLIKQHNAAFNRGEQPFKISSNDRTDMDIEVLNLMRNGFRISSKRLKVEYTVLTEDSDPESLLRRQRQVGGGGGGPGDVGGGGVGPGSGGGGRDQGPTGNVHTNNNAPTSGPAQPQSQGQQQPFLPQAHQNTGASSQQTPTVQGSQPQNTAQMNSTARPDYSGSNYAALGWVTHVWDQGLCGSCWAFAANAVIEGQIAKRNQQADGKPLLLKLSEQQLLDCTKDYDNDHCNGGDPTMAWQYLAHYGSQKASQYPYTSQEGDDGTNSTCGYNASSEVPFHVVTHKVLGSADVEARYGQFRPHDVASMLIGLRKIGPIAASMNAKSHLFSLYKEGVYQEKDCPTGQRDHSITLIGYGKDRKTGIDYWFVKNSWGKHWGIKGYALIARGVNQCGIEEDVVFTTLRHENTTIVGEGSAKPMQNAYRGGNDTAAARMQSKKVM